jgi:hypothetical protein
MAKTVEVFSPCTRPDVARRQILELANAGVHAFDDGSRMKPLGEL